MVYFTDVSTSVDNQEKIEIGGKVIEVRENFVC